MEERSGNWRLIREVAEVAGSGPVENVRDADDVAIAKPGQDSIGSVIVVRFSTPATGIRWLARQRQILYGRARDGWHEKRTEEQQSMPRYPDRHRFPLRGRQTDETIRPAARYRSSDSTDRHSKLTGRASCSILRLESFRYIL